MSDHSWNSSGSDEDQDPELGQPVEFGGVLSKASKQQRYVVFLNTLNCIYLLCVSNCQF